MKRLALFIAPFAIFLVQLVAAQQGAQPVDRPALPNFVFDDDGGQVQIVPADLSASGVKKFHGGAVMTQVQQVSIFLGSGWGDAQVRGRQTALIDVAAHGAGASMAELQKHKVKLLPAAPPAEDFSNLSKSPLNDLDIQRKLSEMLQTGAIPAPSSSTIYVVFLGPAISSTLGGTKAGVDYAAYHNVVNLAAGEVRYVVVPFQKDAARQGAAAMRAFAETALNPRGQGGWF